MVKPGTAVTLVISNGVQPVAVPDVVELPRRRGPGPARRGQAALQVTEKFDDDRARAASSCSQYPEAPTTAPKNSVVQLVVSKGPPRSTSPDVVGQPVAEAQATIEAAGFAVSVNQLPGGPGIVLEQSCGDKAPKGATITLYVF